eukprot:XP_011673731.1 PREDICTED: uncharacterized protein LOC105442829 [Strongylocentrotus purpuratus]
MPVSLSEWRVRIGTFVHWIREYEVKERRERLLKERIRRLKVLCERLEAKIGDSGEESEDDKSRQDGPDHKGCPHKTLNIRSSGNSSDIKDLLTTCDQCIQDLLTPSDSHIKDLLTPSDTCIKQLLTPRRERLQRIQRLKVLVERLEAKRGDSGEGSEDDKSRQDDPDPKGCPHKTSNIRSSGNSSGIKDLLTSCDQCIQDLLTASDSHIKEILTPSGCRIKELITPNDCSIKCPNTLNDSTIKDILTQNDSGLKELVTTNDSSIIDLITSEYSNVKDLITSNESKIYNVLSPNENNIKQLIKSDDDYIQEQLAHAYDYVKTKQMGESVSSCHGPSLKSKTDLISGQIPPLSELLLMKSGDVELNPGPREAAGWSLDLEREVLSLVKDVSPVHYYDLCNALDFSHAQSQVILTKNLLDVSNALSEVICSWGVKQRDGSNYKRLLAEKLKSVNLDALATKLGEGGYATQDTPTQGAKDRRDTPQPVVDMSEDEVIQCSEDLKTFYREHLCKIKPDPFDFQSLREFEQIYTNLVLQRRGMTKTKLDYSALLTTTVNGVLPKRFLIEGEGGVGKTTFCSKIAWDWIKGSPEFRRFSWVLVIPLREVDKGQTIGDIMKDYLSENNIVSPKQIDNYILSQPTKVLIVLDGLDEYDEELSAKESSDISQILRLEKFKQCIVLVTTRPWRADQIKSNIY